MAPTVRCSKCKASAPPGAQYCPRCGAFVAAPENFGKTHAPIPLPGVLFLIGLVLAPPAIAFGYAFGMSGLMYGGILVLVILALVLVLGLAF